MELQETIHGLSTTIEGKSNFLEMDNETVDISNTELIITGTNNKVIIGENSTLKKLKITITGNDNTIIIGNRCRLTGNIISIGNSQKISIGDGTTFSNGGVQLLTREGKNITIGKDCMFSNSIEVRTTDSHSIIDLETNKRVNYAEDITIGDHVWVGVNVMILKGVHLPDDSIVGANSVVTKKFHENHIVIGGFPAKIIKTGVTWDRKKIK